MSESHRLKIAKLERCSQVNITDIKIDINKLKKRTLSNANDENDIDINDINDANNKLSVHEENELIHYGTEFKLQFTFDDNEFNVYLIDEIEGKNI